MKHCGFYHKETGALHPVSVLLSDDSSLAANTPPDHIAIDQPPSGLDHLCQRVDIATGQVVDYQPPQPSLDHEWNGKRWQLSQAAIAKDATRRATVARIAALEASQHVLVRALVLGDETARPKLQAIHDELAALA